MKTIISFQHNTPAPEYDHPRVDRRLIGNPHRSTWTHYENAGNGLSSGIWACEPGAWRIEFADTKDEFFSVIEGRIRLTDETGQVTEVGPGEGAVIPAGFKGVFEVVEAVRKYFVVVEAKR